MSTKRYSAWLPLLLALITMIVAAPGRAASSDAWITYDGGTRSGSGKRIVLISGDEEYRSEEALPQLARILSKRHGFHCTVLFAIDPADGTLNPNIQDNIPGLAALRSADLMILFTRFRALPDDQMGHIEAYLERGGPVLGLRTATHAFRFKKETRWAHYGNGYGGEQRAWADGFGRLVLGEKWIAHHGRHKHESTRGLVASGAQDHPIARGIGAGDIWGPSDVYRVRLPLPSDSKPIILGQVIKRAGAYDENDAFYGMSPTDRVLVSGDKNQPMMPIAWTKTYSVPGGQTGRVFTSTIGAATDLVSQGTRRLLINATYWCLGMEDQIPATGTEASLVGSFAPTAFRSQPNAYWRKRGQKPADLR